MEVPKSISGLVIGIVLSCVAFLAGQSFLGTQSSAATAVEVNAIQTTEIAVIKLKLEHIEKLQGWQNKALTKLLIDRGIEPPQK